MAGQARNGQIGEFLRIRRARVRPEDVGVASYGRRRVAGLRREELARLAGVSVSYYTRIEQGQTDGASPSVLEAIACALELDDHERAYLFQLANATGAPPRQQRRPERVSPALLSLMSAMDLVPSAVAGRCMDLLAWTPLGHALLAPHVPYSAVDALPTRPNWARLLFTDPHLRELFVDWEDKTWEVVSYLRMQAGKYPHDSRLAGIIGELCLTSRRFDDLWAAQTVRDKVPTLCRMQHPTVGYLELTNQPLRIPDAPDQLLGTFHASIGSASESALRLLAREVEETRSSVVANSAAASEAVPAAEPA
ncbi:helix-turn-helix transcriptional regulator [Micromonospora sp. NPDC005324]|uniref:helix-turn-helix transcriptional regulator n=1 Tax=Micromonospora sp. NPDC005324 TaxID=3157033 RepID=UPI0033A82FD2